MIKKQTRRNLILPSHFFASDEEKTKLNWFLFEFARELENFIRNKTVLRKALLRKGVDDKVLAGFCIHYSKTMKQQVLDKVAGRISIVRIGYEEIEACLPQIGDVLVDNILTVAAKAWDWQLSLCSECPTRCISEKEQIASMFDDQFYWN